MMGPGHRLAGTQCGLLKLAIWWKGCNTNKIELLDEKRVSTAEHIANILRTTNII
jgi:hypothetical protein